MRCQGKVATPKATPQFYLRVRSIVNSCGFFFVRWLVNWRIWVLTLGKVWSYKRVIYPSFAGKSTCFMYKMAITLAFYYSSSMALV